MQQGNFETVDQLEECMRNKHIQLVKMVNKETWMCENLVFKCAIVYEKALEENRNCVIELLNSYDSESITKFGKSSEALQKASLNLMDSKTKLLPMMMHLKDYDENFETNLQSELEKFQEFLEKEVLEKQRKFDEAKTEEEELYIAFISKIG
jgi:septal ring factor EnvC (AmiA/AmiB activator)